jgi:hypothetical protein
MISLGRNLGVVGPSPLPRIKSGGREHLNDAIQLLVNRGLVHEVVARADGGGLLCEVDVREFARCGIHPIERDWIVGRSVSG